MRGGIIKRKRGVKNGVLIAAFAAGLLLAFFLPAKCLVVILSAAVIILGLCYSKCCR